MLFGGKDKKPAARRGWAGEVTYSLWHMPNALLIEGDTYPIRTDFRAGIEYQAVAAAGKLTAANLYEIWFVDRYPQNVNEAQEGINRFYRREDATKEDHSKGPISV